MAKKKRRDKEVARLRREVEVLKAHMASGTPSLKAKTPTRSPSKQTPTTGTKEIPLALNLPYLKRDLRKSLLLTLAALGILAILYSSAI